MATRRTREAAVRNTRRAAIVAWSFSIYNLVKTTTPGTFTVGHVVAGLSAICTSLIALVLSIIRHVQKHLRPRVFIPARVLVGLGAICFSLYSIVSILESGTSATE